MRRRSKSRGICLTHRSAIAICPRPVHGEGWGDLSRPRVALHLFRRRCAARSRGARSRGASRGFTLLEVLVAIGIFALLTSLLYGTFGATFESARRAEATAEAYRVIRWSMRHLLRDIGMFYPHALLPATSAFEGIDRSRWREAGVYPDDRLRFTSLSHQGTRADAAESDQGEITYFLREETLVREVRSMGGVRRTDEVSDAVWGINFRYLSEGAWREEWPGDGQTAPDAVEINLTLRNEEKSGAPPRQVTTIVSLPRIRP